MKIILNPPDKKTPGYNKRAYQAAIFEEAMEKKQLTPALYKDLVTFLSEFVVIEYQDAAEPRVSNFDALWEHASEEDMEILMRAVSGGSAPVVPPEKSDDSATPSKEAEKDQGGASA